MKQSSAAKRMARYHQRFQGSGKLNLTALMDIFTILVFFLMVNSSNVEVLESDDSIELPESVATEKPEENLVIQVNERAIVVQGRQVAKVDEVLAAEGEIIAGLKKELGYRAAKRPLTEAEKQTGRPVTIMADAHLTYRLLKKIMATCAESSYRAMSFAVRKIGEADEQGGAEA